MNRTGDPFNDPPPEEIPLARAPLVVVLAQLSFDEIASIERKDFIAPFQEEIRSRYPVLKAEEALTINMPEGGISKERLWRFTDRKGEWWVSLKSDFVSIETKSYTSRDDFASRIGEVALAADKVFQIEQLSRVGVRYVDQIRGDELGRLREMVESPMLGIVGSDGIPPPTFALTQMLAEAREGGMSVRWGALPANATPEPGVIPPIGEQSWILDIDVFAPPNPGPTVAVTKAAETAKSLATRAYTFFRWATTPIFLEVYGD
jgi:uncharacterized protein (TIGR04255 family)